MTPTATPTFSDYAGIEYLFNEVITNVWSWDPPSQDPTHVRIPTRPVIPPHINTRTCKPFTGHRFRLGGSKK